MSVREWIESAEKIAYGALNLTPREFEDLQPQEFEKLIAGYTWRKQRDEEKLAYFTCWQVAPHMSRAITVEKILNPLRPEEKKSGEELLKEKEYYAKKYKVGD